MRDEGRLAIYLASSSNVFFCAMSTDRARILFVAANDWYFYWHRFALAERVAAAGYDVEVATPPGRFCEAIAAGGMRHHAIEIDRQGLNPLNDIATIQRLANLYRSLEPTIVHHVAIKPIIYGSIAAKLAKVPAIVNAMPGTGYLFVSPQLLARVIRPGVMAAYRLLLNAPNSRVILENHDDQKMLISRRVLRPDRVVVMPGCGVDTEAFRPGPEPSGPPLVVLPARLLFYKGIAEFVEAARVLRKRGTPARFALVGEGDPGNPASVPPEQLHEWEREGVVELFGWHDDMSKVFAQAHIVCLPSHGGEGIPRSLLEAAACGKPIVRQTCQAAETSCIKGTTDYSCRRCKLRRSPMRSIGLFATTNCSARWEPVVASVRSPSFRPISSRSKPCSSTRSYWARRR